ncbi:helix-turn-helix transcriptional regulator [Paenibacillus qinlingensis]|uniref:helix-turn-helix transcriptional regulator n=1 Tax=Paenibacillus qinlingensis TaxID=1837343 RepID=UPI001563CE91|nr:YafY family protein [Paenibacillus qinlingensis]NQX59967.1 YafY family transcriptional regulator [Paenibacillus qinlingensis]
MNKSQRLISLLMTLNSKRKFTLKQLSEQFEVSKRTILRDFQDLEQLGLPIFTEYGVNGGYQILKERALPPLWFTENEAIGLFFACQSLEYFGSLPFDAEIKTTLDKLFFSFPDDIKHRIERLKKRLRIWTPTVEQPYLHLLLKAALERTNVEAVFNSYSGENKSTLLPLGLYAMNGLWYCPAMDIKTGQVHVIRTDQFASVKPIISEATDIKTISNFLVDSDAAIDRWLGVQVVETELELEVRLTERGVARCQVDVWLVNGLQVNDDGTGIIARNMSSSYIMWAVSFFISLGSEAEVISPIEVRERIQEQLVELAHIYNEQ